MQTTTQSPDLAPVQAARAPTSITTTGLDGKTHTLTIPQTRADVRELKARRSAIADQLENVASRRGELAIEIRNTVDPASRAGLEDRLRFLDSRILQLETDLATTGQQLAATPSQLTAETQEKQPPGSGDDFDEGVMVGGFGVLAVGSILIFFLRRRWRRRAPALPKSAAAEPGRLERLETGMDAIAIEIERISEGQRFVTKLLSETNLAPGTPRVPQRAAIERDPAKG